jgi:hypothetical protein
MEKIFNTITQTIDYCQKDKENNIYTSLVVILNSFSYNLQPLIYSKKLAKDEKIFLLVSFGEIRGFREFMIKTTWNNFLIGKLDEIVNIYVNEYHDLVIDLI